MIPVTVAVQRGEHDAEGAGPLTEEDEEVMSQALLWKQEAPVVHWAERRGQGCYMLYAKILKVSSTTKRI